LVAEGVVVEGFLGKSLILWRASAVPPWATDWLPTAAPPSTEKKHCERLDRKVTAVIEKINTPRAAPRP
jgi:hypothetical protein